MKLFSEAENSNIAHLNNGNILKVRKLNMNLKSNPSLNWFKERTVIIYSCLWQIKIYTKGKEEPFIMGELKVILY